MMRIDKDSWKHSSAIRKYGRCGRLFQERYKSETVESDSYLITVLRYIHQNPVKAGLTKTVKEYEWSSYNEYMKKRVILDIDFALQIFSTNREKAILSFIEHTNEQNEDKGKGQGDRYIVPKIYLCYNVSWG